MATGAGIAGLIIMLLFFLFWFVLTLLTIGLGAGLLILWIWTLVDCVKNEPVEGNERLIWILLVALLNWVGALVYLFVRRPQRIQQLGH